MRTVCAKVQDNPCFGKYPEFLEERIEKPELMEEYKNNVIIKDMVDCIQNSQVGVAPFASA